MARNSRRWATLSSVVNRVKLKMTSKLLARLGTDYVQLNNFSSVGLYNESVPWRKKGKIYEVERIIGKKKKKPISIKAKLSLWLKVATASCRVIHILSVHANNLPVFCYCRTFYILLKGLDGPYGPVLGNLQLIYRPMYWGIYSIYTIKLI